MFFQNEAGKCLFSFLKYEIFEKKKSKYAHYDVTPSLFFSFSKKITNLGWYISQNMPTTRFPPLAGPLPKK